MPVALLYLVPIHSVDPASCCCLNWLNPPIMDACINSSTPRDVAEGIHRIKRDVLQPFEAMARRSDDRNRSIAHFGSTTTTGTQVVYVHPERDIIEIMASTTSIVSSMLLQQHLVGRRRVVVAGGTRKIQDASQIACTQSAVQGRQRIILGVGLERVR